MVAIFEEVLFAARAPVGRIHRETIDHVVGESLGNPAIGGDRGDRPKRQRLDAVPGKGARGLAADFGDAVPGVGHMAHRPAQLLSVDHIVARPRPGIEQMRVAAHRVGKQLARQGERLRPLGDDLAHFGKQYGVGVGGQSWSAVMRNIVWCG